MAKKFIKMNDNKNNLSLGNLVNIIKKYSTTLESSIQHEVFCSIFDINNINNTTVNNYLIGYRAIGLEYKKIYIDLKDKYNNNKEIFIKIISNILTILEEKIYNINNTNIEIINNNIKLNNVCKDLIMLSKTDKSVNNKSINKIYNLI